MLNFAVQFNASAYRQTIVANLPAWLVEPLRTAKASIIRSFYGPKSGRRGPVRRRSARGQAPASQSKKLEQSITQPAMVSATTAEMRVTADYAEMLEFKLNRPFVRSAIADLRRQLSAGRVGL